MKLSGGQRQRIGIARALILRPKFIVCDEPTRGVDVGAKGEIYRLMRTLANEGLAILMEVITFASYPARLRKLTDRTRAIQLAESGAMMGSGGLVVMDEKTCMVDVAKFFMDFIQRESCGKCIPCRVGGKQMLEVLTRITDGAS